MALWGVWFSLYLLSYVRGWGVGLGGGLSYLLVVGGGGGAWRIYGAFRGLQGGGGGGGRAIEGGGGRPPGGGGGRGRLGWWEGGGGLVVSTGLSVDFSWGGREGGGGMY